MKVKSLLNPSHIILNTKGPLWSWPYGSWIYNYLCNQCLSPLTWVRIPLRRGVLYTILCDKDCQWLTAGQWFSPGTPVSSTNKTDRHDIAEILLKVVLNTIKQPNQLYQTNAFIVFFGSTCNNRCNYKDSGTFWQVWSFPCQSQRWTCIVVGGHSRLFYVL